MNLPTSSPALLSALLSGQYAPWRAGLRFKNRGENRVDFRLWKIHGRVATYRRSWLPYCKAVFNAVGSCSHDRSGGIAKSSRPWPCRGHRRSSYDESMNAASPENIAHLEALDDAYSPLVSRLRWRVLSEFGATDVGRNLVQSWRERFTRELSLRYNDINDIMILLGHPDELPVKHRPPAAWRDVNLWGYIRELAALTRQIGLSGPRIWRSTSGKPRPVWIDWIPLMHSYLRHPQSGDESRAEWLNETNDTSESPPLQLPWAKAPLHRRGRPRSREEEPLSVLAACVGRALADPNWTSIATFAHETFNVDFTGGVLKIRCGRLAERMDVFKKL
jgi:hypothetical protein